LRGGTVIKGCWELVVGLIEGGRVVDGVRRRLLAGEEDLLGLEDVLFLEIRGFNTQRVGF
jgi:hypothetical protein